MKASPLQSVCDRFNEKYPVGTSVTVQLDFRDEPFKTVTRSTAQVLSGHSAVIWLEGVTGCYLLDRVTPAAVKTKLRDLGLQKYRMTRVQPWSAEDDEILRTAYAQGKKHAEIGLLLNRTKDAVKTRVRNLGIQGPPRLAPKPIGSEYFDRETGLRIRKVNDARGRRDDNWKRVDVIDWEAINGPLPEGYTLMIANPHMPRTPSNLRLVKKDEVWTTTIGANLPPEARELLKIQRQIEREAKAGQQK